MFEPGKSGNPNGRPKKAILFTELAREHSEAALNVLVECLSSKNERNRIAAAALLIERGWGKPIQEVTGMSQQIVVMNDIIKNDKPARFDFGQPTETVGSTPEASSPS